MRKNVNICCNRQNDPAVISAELTRPPLPRPEKMVVSPFGAATGRRGRVLDSFNSASSSGLLSDRRAERSTQREKGRHTGTPLGLWRCLAGSPDEVGLMGEEGAEPADPLVSPPEPNRSR